MRMRRHERGAALLTAMVIVTLVATLAAAMVWQQWRAVQAETIERSRIQSAWILSGALDWARLILRDELGRGIERVLVDGAPAFGQMQVFARAFMPEAGELDASIPRISIERIGRLKLLADRIGTCD